MTLDEIAALPKEFLTPADVAPYLQCDPHTLRILARDDPNRLLFPFMMFGNRMKIPKRLFVQTFAGRNAAPTTDEAQTIEDHEGGDVS